MRIKLFIEIEKLKYLINKYLVHCNLLHFYCEFINQFIIKIKNKNKHIKNFKCLMYFLCIFGTCIFISNIFK